MLCQDPDGPVARHRVRALTGHLCAAGFDDVTFHPIPKRLHQRGTLFRAVAQADVTLLLRKLFTRIELSWLRRAVPRLAFDFDDAVMLRDPFRGRPESRVRAARFRHAVAAADLVLAGNDELSRRAAPHVRDGARCVIAPTPVDTDRFVPMGDAAAARPGTVRIGWIGSRSTRGYLRGIAQPLARVLAARPQTQVAVMADAAPDLPFDVDFTPWSAAAEVPFLQSLDVGVMPLTDDAWSRGKCGFKLLQYMACGVAAVASPVGVNVVIADGGRAALLADDAPGAWKAALLGLVDDPETTRALGASGRARVERDWSVARLGPPYARALAELSGPSPSPSGSAPR